MDRASTLAVDVLGDVGQQREVGEGADYRDGLVDVDAVEHRRQLGAVDLGAPHAERLHAGAFDEVENVLAVLLADGLAEDGAEQSDVFAHRFGGLTAHLGALYRADGFQSADLSHAPSIDAPRFHRMTSACGTYLCCRARDWSRVL